LPQQFEGSRTARVLLGEIETKLDTIMSRLASILSQLDVALSTRASEATITSILTRLGYLIAYLYPPSTAYFDDDASPFTDWDALLIAANDITLGVTVTGYTYKTIYFISDTQGALTIQVLEPDGTTWRDFDVLGISANVLRSYQMEEQVTQLRITFDQAATVSAWITLGVA
jgi:hypothetical protein